MRLLRTSWWQTGGLLGLAALVAGAALSCDMTPLDPTQSMDPTQSITVVVSGNAFGLEGVSVELFEAGGTSPIDVGVTDDQGELTLMDMAPGSYEVEIEIPVGYVTTGEDTNREAVTVGEEEAAVVSFTLGLDPNVVEVHMTSDFRFSPADLTISPGTTVRWINDVAMLHTVSPNDHSEWERAQVTQADELFHHRFETAGEFPYYCEPHRTEGMVGSVAVEAP